MPDQQKGHAGHLDVTQLRTRCDLLRSWQVPGSPLLLPNAWDVASARAVVAAGFSAVATTSGGVAATLGYDDHQGAPGAEMFAAAARIVRSVDVPVTVDAEAGYGMSARDLVAALRSAGAAGCNLEDTDHATGELRHPDEQAAWPSEVRAAASDAGYPLVINARIDVFLANLNQGPQRDLVGDALVRARACLGSGADCVYPIGLWEPDALTAFMEEVDGPVNLLASPRAPSVPELAEHGAARISWGTLLHRGAMERFSTVLTEIASSARSPVA